MYIMYIILPDWEVHNDEKFGASFRGGRIHLQSPLEFCLPLNKVYTYGFSSLSYLNSCSTPWRGFDVLLQEKALLLVNRDEKQCGP